MRWRPWPLGRLLALAISAMFLVALVGVEAIHLRSAQAHMQRQLESLAQDAATSLGLSLGALLRGGDPALAETVVNPAFDRGHYERIEYLSASGERVVSRHLPAGEGAYPEWFAEVFRLHAPTAESLVSAGWRQAGRVRVTVHPRFAYEQLWNTARDTVILLLLIYAATLLVLRLVLRGVLRPLAEVEKAAQAISARRFVTLRLRPSTRELARVVEAMNALSLKVSEALEAETRRAERLQAAAYHDPVTGLLNAAGFTARFETLYEGEDESFVGVLALVELADLGAINREIGAERCDALLRELLGAIDQTAAALGGFSGRWSGAATILALPRLSSVRARETLAALRIRVSQALREGGLGEHDPVYAGGIEAGRGRPDLQTLSRGAQEALRSARQTAEGVAVAGSAMDAALDDSASSVREALSAQRLRLVGQLAYRTSDHRALHTEVLARLYDVAGQEMAGARFMPYVVAQGLAEELDKAVIEKVLREARRGTEERISINVSARSAEMPAFLAWLGQRLARERALAARLTFELPEHGVLRNEAAAAQFAQTVTRAGAAFAIDNFGVHRDCLALLQRLHPTYVKLAGVQVRRIVTDPGARSFAESVVRAARQLDIPAFALHVEDDETFQVIGTLGFAGYQGNL
ncbi:MAG TPA: EAL domain-containing protein, partial [Burkholderiales bacterium]|nr:EAL domain-containing protein [Burkholderiales bacterium]